MTKRKKTGIPLNTIFIFGVYKFFFFLIGVESFPKPELKNGKEKDKKKGKYLFIYIFYA